MYSIPGAFPKLRKPTISFVNCCKMCVLFTRTHTHIYMCVCVCIYMCVYIYIYMYIQGPSVYPAQMYGHLASAV
jgi:hypothetical protein